MDAEAIAQMTAGAHSQHRPKAIVRSAFELPEPQQAPSRMRLTRHLPATSAIEFETAPDLVGGIELTLTAKSSLEHRRLSGWR